MYHHSGQRADVRLWHHEKRVRGPRLPEPHVLGLWADDPLAVPAGVHLEPAVGAMALAGMGGGRRLGAARHATDQVETGAPWNGEMPFVAVAHIF